MTTATKPLFTQAQEAYITSQRVARLATADAEGRPNIVPVCFAFEGQLFYIALDNKPKSVPHTRLKRVRNIEANPQVSIMVDTYSEDWSRLQYVLVNGIATIEPPGTQRHADAMPLLREKYPQYRSMPIEERPIIAIAPTSTHAWAGGVGSNDIENRAGIDFATLARGRHVVRQFKPEPVSRELVEMTLEAARWAPSPHGAQPWRFVVLTRPELKQQLADAMADEWRRNLEMDGESAEVVAIRQEKSRRRIEASPVLIIPCLYLDDLHHYPDPARQEAEVTMAVQSLGATIQNLLLSAYSLGLDTGWMCAPLFCPDIVRQALDLAPTLIPHALINMGYGAKDPPRRPHRPVSELVVRYD
ncbi:MAG TPA: TIGR03668 family PPOX class F420-dependent oxidoreductase [Chloroflexia bacterium]|nr:TIGR03668 family PPOX class F420-dependent oxidoreductase [Chloroflexia bacterium]